MGGGAAGFISLDETAQIADRLKRVFLAALDAAIGLERIDHSFPEAAEARVALSVCSRSLAELSFAAEELFPVTVPPIEFEAAYVTPLPPGLSYAARAAYLLDEVIATFEEIRAMVESRGRLHRDGNLLSFLRDASGVVAECGACIERLTKI